MLHPSYNYFTTERICAPLCQQVQSLTEKLAERDAELAKREKREQLLAQANRKRGLMVLLSFSVMLASAIIKDERIAIPLIFCWTAPRPIMYNKGPVDKVARKFFLW